MSGYERDTARRVLVDLPSGLTPTLADRPVVDDDNEEPTNMTATNEPTATPSQLIVIYDFRVPE
jgi:hypothetical protein